MIADNLRRAGAHTVHRTLFAIMASLGLTQAVMAQPSTGLFGSSMTLQGLIVVALAGLVIVLLVIAIWALIRRERHRHPRTGQRKGGAGSGARADAEIWGPKASGRAARDAELPGVRSMRSRAADDENREPLALRREELEDIQKKMLATQTSLIARGEPGGADAKSIYKTGINPFYKPPSEHIEVTEVADAVMQAELMTSLGLYEQAIELLTRHIQETEKPEPTAWLLLFDLYAKTDREEQYTELAGGFKALFNAELPSWETYRRELGRSLEDYEAVLGKVQRLWGMPTCKSFLESLLYDDRGGSRQGFMFNAYKDIVFLLAIIDIIDEIKREEDEKQRIALKIQERPIVR